MGNSHIYNALSSENVFNAAGKTYLNMWKNYVSAHCERKHDKKSDGKYDARKY